jgi:hypothetical protein
MRVLLFLASVLTLAGCNEAVLLEHLSHTESVCQAIGFCITASSDDIAACDRETAVLHDAANASGCAALFDSFYACADERYDCEGNVPSFPGCEAARSLLRACLARDAAQNACGAIDAALAACATAGAGAPRAGDATTATALPPPCVGGSVCVARCYLDRVPDVCRPMPAQLSAALTCAQRCLF